VCPRRFAAEEEEIEDGSHHYLARVRVTYGVVRMRVIRIGTSQRQPQRVPNGGEQGAMRRSVRIATVSAAVVAVSLALAGSALAESHAFVDFEGLPEGKIVSSVSSGSGISGDAVPGSVGLAGVSADPAVTGNAAMIYDSACGGGGPADCTGDEYDKFRPELGKVLMVAKSVQDANGDGLADRPDVTTRGGMLRFDFTRFGPGAVTIVSLDVLDIESRRGTIALYARGSLIGTVPIPVTGDAGFATVAVGRSGIDRMDVTLGDSGVVDNLHLIVGAAIQPSAPRSCGSLRLGVRSLVVGRRTAVPVTVRDTLGVRMAGKRVVARGAGVLRSGRTNARGVVRLVVQPRRAGIVRFSVPGAPRCAKRLAVASVFRPPAITG